MISCVFRSHTSGGTSHSWRGIIIKRQRVSKRERREKEEENKWIKNISFEFIYRSRFSNSQVLSIYFFYPVMLLTHTHTYRNNASGISKQACSLSVKESENAFAPLKCMYSSLFSDQGLLLESKRERESALCRCVLNCGWIDSFGLNKPSIMNEKLFLSRSRFQLLSWHHKHGTESK